MFLATRRSMYACVVLSFIENIFFASYNISVNPSEPSHNFAQFLKNEKI